MYELLFWTLIAVLGNLLMIIVIRKAAKLDDPYVPLYTAACWALPFFAGLSMLMVGTGVLVDTMSLTLLNIAVILAYTLYLFAKPQNQTSPQD